ncbi:MAG: hypothetical protein RLP44_08825 [Aggregatilineales bacterium]
MRQQIFDHGLVEGFGADTLCLARLTARVLHRRADEKAITAALALLAGDALDIHGVFFAIHMPADNQTGEQIIAPDSTWLMVAIYLLAIVLFGVLRLPLLLGFKPLMRNHRWNEFLV